MLIPFLVYVRKLQFRTCLRMHSWLLVEQDLGPQSELTVSVVL